MGLFVSSKKEKETWASIVLSGIKPGMQIDDALLEKVADIYINQHDYCRNVECVNTIL